MASYASQVDLEVALGGPSVLLQLADLAQTGSLADAGAQIAVVDYLDTGAARVRAATEVKHEPEVLATLTGDSLKLLKAWNVDLSARIAWERGGRGQAVPRYVQERAERAERDLDRLARGELRLGRAAGGQAAAINQPVSGAVDYDTDGTGFSLTAFRNSGFR